MRRKKSNAGASVVQELDPRGLKGGLNSPNNICAARNFGSALPFHFSDRVVEGEEQRLSFLRDRCVAEITQRVPADKAEHDQVLCVRIAHELNCNGRIDRLDAPDLLIKALKAWG